MRTACGRRKGTARSGPCWPVWPHLHRPHRRGFRRLASDGAARPDRDGTIWPVAPGARRRRAGRGRGCRFRRPHHPAAARKARHLPGGAAYTEKPPGHLHGFRLHDLDYGRGAGRADRADRPDGDHQFLRRGDAAGEKARRPRQRCPGRNAARHRQAGADGDMGRRHQRRHPELSRRYRPDRALVRQAARVVIMADHCKVGISGRVRFCPLAQIDTLVVDAAARARPGFEALVRATPQVGRGPYR